MPLLVSSIFYKNTGTSCVEEATVQNYDIIEKEFELQRRIYVGF